MDRDIMAKLFDHISLNEQSMLKYLDFFQNYLPGYLEKVLLDVRQRM